APPPADTWVSLADRKYPHALDGTLAPPGIVSLSALSKTEALLSFAPPQAHDYMAVVDLASACVTETHTVEELGGFLPIKRMEPGQIIAYLVSEAGQRLLGPHMAALARFDLHRAERSLARGHADATGALSADHRKMAVTSNAAIFYSDNGGLNFARVAEKAQLDPVQRVSFSPDGRFLFGEGLRRVATPPGENPTFTPLLVVVDVHGETPTLVGEIDLTATPAAPKHPRTSFSALGPITPQGAPLYASPDTLCILGANATTLHLDALACAPTAKLVPGSNLTVSPSGIFGYATHGDLQAKKGWVFPVDGHAPARTLPDGFYLQNATIGPDDAGRVGWDRGPKGFRVDTADATYDLDWKPIGSPLAFDLDGNILGFKQPPLVRPHRPGASMPPTVGTLADTKCTLLSRVDPKSGKRQAVQR
ncbi:MAG: hypothetical protein HOO96_41035, partial [Polyangiaceae bacterium]|nr:hypothetical protein [Polyangiaceae bacterium]